MKRYFKSLSLKTQLFLSFAVFIAASLSLLFIICLVQIRSSDKETGSFSVNNSVMLAGSYIEKTTSEIRTLNSVLTQSYGISQMIDDNGEASIYTRFANLNTIKNIFSFHNNLSNVVSVKLYVYDDANIIVDNNYVGLISDIESSGWYQKMAASQNKMYCFSDIETGTAAKRITSAAWLFQPDDNIRRIGLITVSIDEEQVKNILTSAVTIDNSVTLLLNSDKEIVSVSNQELLDNFHLSLSKLQMLPEKDEWQFFGEGNAFYILRKDIYGTDWSLMSITPIEAIYKSSRSIIVSLLIGIAVIAMLMYFLSFILSRTITKPINLLADKAREVTLGGSQPIQITAYSTEMRDLIDAYNKMTEEIESLAQHEIEMGVRQKNMELDLLQSQVNPHFLYNTLNLAHYLCDKGDTKKAGAVIAATASFYKQSLHHGKNWSSVEEEIKHLNSYMTIQRMRFDNAIDYETRIPEAVLGLRVPHITLQPIVENAIYHGILNKTHPAGEITVTANIRDDAVEIMVRDNGVGISQDKLQTLLQDENQKSFGLMSIHKRIRLAYGESYGVAVKSAEGKYTEVTVRIPLKGSDKVW